MNTDSDAQKSLASGGKRPAAAGGTARAARLKSALKANMARRKAQARARDAAADPDVAESDPGATSAPDENDKG